MIKENNFKKLDNKDLKGVIGGGISDYINGAIYEILHPSRPRRK